MQKSSATKKEKGSSYEIIARAFASHAQKMKSDELSGRLTPNQLAWRRAVSLFDVIQKTEGIHDTEYLRAAGETAQKFPKQGSFSSDEPDNIRYEPMLNEKLLGIVLPCLEILARRPGTVGKSAAGETAIVRKEITEAHAQNDKVPDILVKDLTGGKSPVPGKTPKVSVIVTSMNLKKYIGMTLQSIMNQSYDSLECIVIDGGSTDGSVEIIKKYPNVILVSEKDSGYDDAFWKGLRMARGEYILQCCTSDGYASRDWIKKCAEVLDRDKDVSLVWGISCGLDARTSKPAYLQYPPFHYSEGPQKEQMFDYWLQTGRFQPEVNLCIRKSVLLRCFPSLLECDKRDFLDWMECTYRFNRAGYISVHIPMLANYFHMNHEGNYSQKLDTKGWYNGIKAVYFRKLKHYRWMIIFHLTTHKFIDAEGKVVMKYDWKKLAFEYLVRRNLKYFRPSKYQAYFKKKFS